VADKIQFPKWVFEKIHAGCNKFLVCIEPNGEVSVDGCHSDAQGVAKAKKLYESIAVIRPPSGSLYAMITIEEVPALTKDTINHEAVATLNHMGKKVQDAKARRTNFRRTKPSNG